MITVVMLIACSCIVIGAQDPEKASSAKKTSVSRLTLTPPDFVFGQSQTRSQTFLPASSTKSDGIKSPFVVQNGAVYATILNGRYLIPIPGGGASGCFSLDLPQRTTNLREFVPRLSGSEQDVVKQN